MLLILSPAKTLDFSKTDLKRFSEISFPKETKELAGILKKMKSADLAKLMDVSDKIATLNVERNQSFSPKFDFDNAKQAILAFKGDVYLGLQADDFDSEDFSFAHNHLRILSGLYGLLRPLDLIQPYRLEMGTHLLTKKGKNLYEFWGDKITKAANESLQATKDNILVNLASQEYFAAINPKKLKGKIIHIHFKEKRNDKLQIISFSAKKARGMMARYAIRNRITEVEDLKGFREEGYLFQDAISTETEWVFVR